MNKQYSPVERANRNSYKAVSSGTTSNKWKWIAITLTILILIGAVVYFDNQAQQEKYNKGYETGVNETSQLIYAQLVNTAFQCKSIPLTYNQTTINLIAYECLQNDIPQTRTLNLDNKTAKGLNYFCRQGETANDCIKRYETPMELKR